MRGTIGSVYNVVRRALYNLLSKYRTKFEKESREDMEVLSEDIELLYEVREKLKKVFDIMEIDATEDTLIRFVGSILKAVIDWLDGLIDEMEYLLDKLHTAKERR